MVCNLIFITPPVGVTMPPPVAIALVKGDCQIQNRLKLTCIAPMMKEGQKFVQIISMEDKIECHNQENALIEHVMRGTPSFKDMLSFFYSVWNLWKH